VTKTYGVLALQGAFSEHVQILRQMSVQVVEVRLPEQLAELDGLILPGGESTTVGKLAVAYNLVEPIREMALRGIPVWGTCAGMIMMAKDAGHRQPLLGVMDIVVKRNAFGRQLESFETDLTIPALDEIAVTGELGQPFRGVFIRAPVIESFAPNVQALACLKDGQVVAAQQGNMLVTAFHPELSSDTRFHRYFLSLAT